MLPCLRRLSGALAEDGDRVADHVRGAVYGQCIGDALGLATEFMSKREAIAVYDDLTGGDRASLTYAHIYQDFHRFRWKRGDWTDDSDQALLLLASVLSDDDGRLSVCDFAARLTGWRESGFPEFGDKGGMGIGRTVLAVLTHDRFHDDPHGASEDVWRASGRYLAANGAIMRCSMLAVAGLALEEDELLAVTVAAARVTHADPRSIAACVALTHAIAASLRAAVAGEPLPSPAELTDSAYALAEAQLSEESEEDAASATDLSYTRAAAVRDLKHYMYATDLADLQLDDKSTIGYAFKALGAAFWALRSELSFHDTLLALIYEGGDADSNACGAAALLGARIGHAALPAEWRDGLLHGDWLEQRVLELLARLLPS